MNSSIPSLQNYQELADLRQKNTNKNEKPLVSIITIVYNGEATIEKTIQSVLSQTYKNIEYIIVDGGSTDGTIEIIKKYNNQIAFWISEKDEGISDAFNKGIALTNGDIIGIINADDWYEVEAVEKAVGKMQSEEADLVHGMLQYWEGNEKADLAAGNAEILEKEMAVNHPSVFAKRSLYEEIGLFRKDFRYAMDYEWILRAKLNGARFSYLESCLANMKLDGVSDRFWEKSLREVLKAKNLHLPKLSNYLFYAYQVSKRSLRHLLEISGLHAIVYFYRENYASVKKTRLATP